MFIKVVVFSSVILKLNLQITQIFGVFCFRYFRFIDLHVIFMSRIRVIIHTDTYLFN